MAGSKLYQSEAWLKRKYLIDKMDPADIGKLCGVSQMTIYRYIDKFKLRR